MAHYFLAIRIPTELQEMYGAWQKEMQQDFPYKKWTATEDLHITLVFLGSVEDETLQKLVAHLHDIQASQGFSLTLEGLGIFGQRNRPRVLFVDIQPNEFLNELQGRVAEVTEKVGFDREKRSYRPHVTLAKQWASTDKLPEALLEQVQTRYSAAKSFDVSEFTLYKIHPGRVPSYESIAVFPLEG